MAAPHYDIAIVGAGPVGSLCAIAHARRGARVALLEANPGSTKRMAGEWLHPPAVKILQDLGIQLDAQPHSSRGRGFVVLPEDRSDSIVLPYANGGCGLACEHAEIVAAMRAAVQEEPGIDFITARVRSVADHRVEYSRDGDMYSLVADRIVGADGRGSVVRRFLGLPVKIKQTRSSRMVGVTVRGVALPEEGYGHLLCGAPGPIFMYRLGEEQIRVIVDIPLHYWNPKDRVGFLFDVSARFLPESIREAFHASIREGEFHSAANALSPRITYGTSDHVIIGDAAGHYHPLTAVGMTLGFGDALALAEADNFHDFVVRRFKKVRTPEILAMEIYEVFADYRTEAASVRHAVYRRWRASASFRDNTMRLLACEAKSSTLMAFEGGGIVFRTLGSELPRSFNRSAWRRTWGLTHSLAVRLNWLARGVWRLNKLKNADQYRDEGRIWDSLSRALLVSMPSGVNKANRNGSGKPASLEVSAALNRAGNCLMRLQGEKGEWEGEMVWCPMLTAQYVLLHYILGRPIDTDRCRRILRSFAHTRLSGGAWGMHAHSESHLFVTTLVYVAARLLGVDREDPLIRPAREFLQTEGVINIPTWGKFWLAILNLYSWKGVNAMLPELWILPRRVPLHPANWYCHTRLIYMGVASVYEHRHQVPVKPVIACLREELFPEGYDRVNFSTGRNRLRQKDLFAPPSLWLRGGYGLAQIIERFHSKKLRARCLEEMLRRIRWELQTTNHTNISPVSGFLNILALWLHDPDDEDCWKAFERLEDWIWEDEEHGVRVTGARSSSWDTGFSLQALATVREMDGVRRSLQRGAGFLAEQQISESFEGFEEAFRTDPRGGWCFPGAWHGWPVSDCTAEAILGILAADPNAIRASAVRDAVRFILLRQNRDGGFGSYEPRRSRVGLEWLNPAEMFGESMTEHSYVECTASCLAALAACRTHFPQVVGREVDRAILRGENWLRFVQMMDGRWRGVWGIQYIYGTLFGVRGLLAAGAAPGDSAVRLSCQWLLEQQRSDGGWGEHYSGSLSGKYVPHPESQVIHTAWALIALLEAYDSNWTAITRGIQFLMDMQNEDGTWPKQDMAGVFFRTALLDYTLYRQYFPLHALGLYAERHQDRLELKPSRASNGVILQTHRAASTSLDATSVRVSGPERKALA